MRSFDRCLPNQAWMVFRHFGELSFFVSTYKDDTEHKSELLRQRYPNSQVEIEVVDKQPVFEFDHDWIPGQCYTHEPYSISVSPQAVMAQLWQLEQGYRLFLSKTSEDKMPDCIIRCRPDLWFHSFRMFAIPQDHHCYTPWWGRFGSGVNDRFAVMGKEAAYHYFYTFNHSKSLIERGCPLHPESLVGASMEKGEIYFSTNLKAEFSTLRENGEMRFPEISSIDIAHAAMR